MSDTICSECKRPKASHWSHTAYDNCWSTGGRICRAFQNTRLSAYALGVERGKILAKEPPRMDLEDDR